MSKSTKSILRLINLTEIIRQRNKNFMRLKNHLKLNPLFDRFTPKKNASPIGFPLKVDDSELAQKKLANEGIYAVRYWPELKDLLEENCFEKILLDKILFLPINEMPSEKKIDKIIDVNT